MKNNFSVDKNTTDSEQSQDIERTSQYTVKTNVFEGPLDLLLSLIEKRKLFINDISLAQVADDYIEYINKQEDFPMAHTADFILIASTLVLIKSKSLLPALTLSEEEQESIDDLEKRLKLHRRMKEFSRYVSQMFGKKIMFVKTSTKDIMPVFSPDKDLTVSKIMEGIREVLHNLPKKVIATPKAVVEKVISLEEMIEDLTKRINKNLKMSFKEFSGIGKEEKVNVIIGFLAMLELVKQGILSVTQDKHFSDITMETDNIGTPEYE
ncbi:MAG: ScpA family protein [Candidatus Pacebacteria bacterium]|jgi:segregation and condensation protein A|nr:ScpA family protein [Candidatus Paceibacterota bacterium]|tara:strand:+ start:2783 stop:3580 length:798 start_codon:yes stop_codon:yes gene_type:complete